MSGSLFFFGGGEVKNINFTPKSPAYRQADLKGLKPARKIGMGCDPKKSFSNKKRPWRVCQKSS